MARIWVKRSRDGHCVTVAGHLGAADLRRLERACGPALEQRYIALRLDLTTMTGSDPVSQAFLERLVDRGARIQSRGDRRESPDGLPPNDSSRANNR
ncbi:MAG TPA: hypothetical protein VG106_05365 [Vicinamibacterales bacterium]|nr:hypothetical protein [Vicinamibacterales bacterium]